MLNVSNPEAEIDGAPEFNVVIELILFTLVTPSSASRLHKSFGVNRYQVLLLSL